MQKQTGNVIANRPKMPSSIVKRPVAFVSAVRNTLLRALTWTPRMRGSEASANCSPRDGNRKGGARYEENLRQDQTVLIDDARDFIENEKEHDERRAIGQAPQDISAPNEQNAVLHKVQIGI